MNTQGISLRLSVTDSCQLRCRYCRSADDSERVATRPLPSDDLLLMVHLIHETRGISVLRFTGGEPLLRRDLVGLVAACRTMGIPDIALTTNAQRLAARAVQLQSVGLQRLNVSLDSLDERTFAMITRGGTLRDSLGGIEAAKNAGICPVKLNMVVMGGVNDHEVAQMLDFGIRNECHVRFLELMPIGVAAGEFDHHFVPWGEVHTHLLASGFRLTPLACEPGATSRNYVAMNRDGRTTICGFISPSSKPFCGGCRRLRLTADGRLLGCLACRRQVNLLPFLDNDRQEMGVRVARAVDEALQMKRLEHRLAEQRNMAYIGG